MRENHIHHGRDVGIFTFDNGMVIESILLFMMKLIVGFVFRVTLRRTTSIIIELLALR